MKCKICKIKLGSRNKSGYCTKCYPKSPQCKEYQRNFQIKWYSKPKNKAKKTAYRIKNKVKRRKYMREYQRGYRKRPEVMEKNRLRMKEHREKLNRWK